MDLREIREKKEAMELKMQDLLDQFMLETDVDLAEIKLDTYTVKSIGSKPSCFVKCEISIE